jgi:biopolymer transport protein ExbD
MRPRRRKRKVGFLVPTTSMGDIAFLLIIFFILCSTKKAGITVHPPMATGLENLPKPTIYVAIDSENRMWLDGAEVSSAGEIESGVSARLVNVDANAPLDRRSVVFECDREVAKEVFEPVLEAIAKAGAVIAAVGTERKAPPGR